MAEIQFCGFEGAWHTTVQPCDRVDGINLVFAHSLFPHPAIARINQMTRGNKSKIQNIFHLRRWRSQIMLNMAAFFLLLKPCRQIAKKSHDGKNKSRNGKATKVDQKPFSKFRETDLSHSSVRGICNPISYTFVYSARHGPRGREERMNGKKSTFGNSVDFFNCGSIIVIRG